MTAPPSSPAAAPGRRAFLRPRSIVLVFVGGCLGAAGREGLVLAFPTGGGMPWVILVVNLTGALLLGLLVALLSARGGETPRARDLRLLLGTGLLGGFTTYSALATDAALLLGTDPVVGAGYALGSVLAGVAAAAAGLAIGALARRAR